MDTISFRQFETVRTTVTLPVELLARLQCLVDEGLAPSRNALLVTAVERLLADLERAAIDKQFAALADDPTYNAQSESIAAEFATADWEALRLVEEAQQ